MATSAYNTTTRSFADTFMLNAADLGAFRADLLDDAQTGPGFTSAAITNGHLILTRTDGTTLDVGQVVGATGAQGATGATGASGAGSPPGFTSAAIVNGHLILTKSDTTTLDVGQVVGSSTSAPGFTGASIVNGHLILTKSDTTTVDVGQVVGATGPAGSGSGSSSAYTAITPITANVTLTSAQAGSLFLANTTGVTVTFPARASMPANGIFKFSADHLATGGTVVVNMAGSDLLNIGLSGTPVATYTLQPGDTWEVVAGSSAWETVQQPFSAISEAYSAIPAGSGWQDNSVLTPITGGQEVTETAATLAAYLQGKLELNSGPGLQRTVYTTAGVISPADDRAIVQLSADGVMTLADGTVDGHEIIIKRLGPAAVTVVANFDGAQGPLVLPATTTGYDSVTLEWTATLTTPTYILI